MQSKYGHLSKEELIAQLTKRDAERKLGLVWERDAIEHDRALNGDFVALSLVSDLSVGVAPYQNLVIEGDNFDALRYLSIAYRGRVKCIYIDPPYNTGSQDFIYNDRFVDKDDAWKHSKWLEFMYRRLILARDLLADDGVILVSINDENRSKLELLMDQAMPGMRIGSFVWRCRTGGNDTGGAFLSDNHEHILVYGGREFKFSGDEKSYSMYRYEDAKGIFRLSDLSKAHDYKERPNTYYPLYDPETDIWYPCNPDNVWRFSSRDRLKPGQKTRSDCMEELIDKKLIWFPTNQRIEVYPTLEALYAAIDAGDVPKSVNSLILRRELPEIEDWVGKKIGFGRPAYKRYKETLKNENQPISSWLTPKSEASTVVEDGNMPIVGTTEEGSKLLKDIMGNKAFPYPKPLSLVKNLIAQAVGVDGIVVDFFAGSGTTAHAVLELNKEDEESRTFIMVSSTEATPDDPEKNICRDVCAQRIKNVINGYNGGEGTGGNFAYMRTQRIPFDNLLLDIRHDQVWYTLQLTHHLGVTPFTEGTPYQEAHGASTVIYIPELNPGSLAAVVSAANETNIPMVIYTWQPGALAQSIFNDHVCVEQVPEYLTERFGGGVA